MKSGMVLSVVSLMLVSHAFPDSPGRSEKANASKIIGAFTKNRAAFEQYLVLVDIDRSSESLKNATASANSRGVVLHSYDAQRELSRVDDQWEVTTIDQTASTMSVWKTIVEHRTERKEYMEGRLIKAYDGSLDKLKDPPLRIDPWSASLASPVSFRNGTAERNYELGEFPIEKLVKYADVETNVIMRFQYGENSFCDITFDSKKGNMPVECTWKVRENAFGFDELSKKAPQILPYCRIRTQWESVRDVGWVPIFMVRDMVAGDPRKPSYKEESVLRFSWVFGSDDFPVGVFDAEKFSAPSLLRILQGKVN